MQNVSIYVLACQEIPARLEAARDECNRAGLPFTIWESIHGKTWGLETTREYDPNERISPGHVGLLLGHWNLWQHLYHTLPMENSVAVVFEDDVAIPPDFASQVLGYRGLLQWNGLAMKFFPDWEFLFLGLAEKEPAVWGKVTERVGSPVSPFCRLRDPFGTHAYAVRRSALRPLLDNMRLAERNIDQQLYRDVLAPGKVKWAAYLPSIVRQKTYDYCDEGKPQWAPSTIDAIHSARAGAVEATESQLRDISTGKPQDHTTIAATLAVTNPYPCIYRGEYVDLVASDVKGRSVPLTQCARLDVLCHQKHAITKPTYANPHNRIVRKEATACEDCNYRLGMELPVTRKRLPLPEGHFNPSMIEYNGKLIFATRDSWGHSRCALFHAQNTRDDWMGDWSFSPIASIASTHSLAPRLEDPRLFIAPDHKGQPRLHAVFSIPDGYPAKRVRVGFCQFTDDLQAMDSMTVFESPHDNLYEKNWVPFVHNRELYWVYATKPTHAIYRQLDSGALLLHASTHNRLPWAGGFVRGGAAPMYHQNPVPIDPHALGFFRHFFHGALKRPEGTAYTVGVADFRAGGDFRVFRQTRKPILFPDLPAVGESVVKRYVVWPGGAVLHRDRYFVSLGIDDTFCDIQSFDKGWIDSLMNATPEDVELEVSATLRETEIAKGFKY